LKHPPSHTQAPKKSYFLKDTLFKIKNQIIFTAPEVTHIIVNSTTIHFFVRNLKCKLSISRMFCQFNQYLFLNSFFFIFKYCIYRSCGCLSNWKTAIRLDLLWWCHYSDLLFFHGHFYDVMLLSRSFVFDIFIVYLIWYS